MFSINLKLKTKVYLLIRKLVFLLLKECFIWLFDIKTSFFYSFDK